VDLGGSGLSPAEGCDEHGNELSGSIKDGKFHYQPGLSAS
jgi:hypothetical protein